MTVLDIAGFCPRLTATRGLQLVAQDGSLGARSGTGVEMFATADLVSAHQAETLARRLAPYRTTSHTSVDTGDDDQPAQTWSQMLGVGDVGRLNPEHAWLPRQGRARLRVPIGVGVDGNPVEIDLKESAENGMGPHGLCIGATGSGKSEFLRTLVLGLIATHSPDALNLVLVDFKGGATFLGLEGSPRRRGDHQPCRRTGHGRQNARRARRGDESPAGIATLGRELRQRHRLRKGASGRRRPRPAAGALHRGRRILGIAQSAARIR